jgi:hypothetical protein
VGESGPRLFKLRGRVRDLGLGKSQIKSKINLKGGST